MEKQAILGTIRQLKGDKLMAAKLLGIGKTTLYRKLKEYGITEGLGIESELPVIVEASLVRWVGMDMKHRMRG